MNALAGLLVGTFLMVPVTIIVLLGSHYELMLSYFNRFLIWILTPIFDYIIIPVVTFIRDIVVGFFESEFFEVFGLSFLWFGVAALAAYFLKGMNVKSLLVFIAILLIFQTYESAKKS